jgi:hypothetical protein
MTKSFDDKFDDSTDFTFYRITITSENGQRQTFDGVRGYLAREVYDQLVEQAADDEVAA